MLNLYREAQNPYEAWPLGNSRLGAMVFGGVRRERVILNEDTLWSGHPVDRSNPEALARLPKIRELLFAGENYEAQKLIETYVLGELSESYMPMGDMYLDTGVSIPAEGYCHSLSMEEGVATVTYRQAGVGYTRRAYVSQPDDVIVLEWEADTAGALSFRLSLESQLHVACEVLPNGVRMTGQCPDHVAPNYEVDDPNPIIYGEGKGLRFCVEARVYTRDGVLTQREDGLQVTGATRCVILCSARNTFAHADYVKDCAADLDKAAAHPDDLLRRHTEDFSEQYGRTTLTLGEEGSREYDMAKLVEAARRGEKVQPLYEALFGYGRYLSIASSRRGLPANLQGIWNWDLRPAWSGNWTTNINLPMNYWHTEMCGLPECGEQLARWLETMIPAGEQSARDYFGADGWCMHHNVDMWGKMTPTQCDARFGFWPMAGVWLCQHIYRHYTYTGDTVYLKEHGLPIMEGAVRFCLSWLIEDGKGQLVTCPSTSPENVFYTGNKQVTAVAISSAADIAMITELLDNYEEACEVLSVNSTLRKRARAARCRMRSFSVDGEGRLLEYDKPYEEVDPGHRHFSPLYGIYPGDSCMGDSRLQPAAEKLFDRRLAYGGGRLGWSRAWAIALAARFGRRVQVSDLLQRFILTSVRYNAMDYYVYGDELPETRTAYEKPLTEEAVGCFQIDGNFGFTAAVAELLVGAYGHRVYLLPCLPVDWVKGTVKGLCIPGDARVDLRWADGRLQEGVLHTGARFIPETPLVLCWDGHEQRLFLEPGTAYKLVPAANGLQVSLL